MEKGTPYLPLGNALDNSVCWSTETETKLSLTKIYLIKINADLKCK